MSLFLLRFDIDKPIFHIINISNNTIDIETLSREKKNTERQSHFPLTRLIALWQEPARSLNIHLWSNKCIISIYFWSCNGTLQKTVKAIIKQWPSKTYYPMLSNNSEEIYKNNSHKFPIAFWYLLIAINCINEIRPFRSYGN